MEGSVDAGYYTYTGLQRDWDGTSNAYPGQEVAMLIYSSSDTTFFDEKRRRSTNQASFMPATATSDYVGNLIGGATLWMLDGMDDVRQRRRAWRS